MKSFEKVYSIVSLIPKGKVMTYKQIAQIAAINNPKIVGFALHANKNPQRVPCHRVVNHKGGLAKGYARGGIKKQKELLTKEGIYFIDEQTVDLRQCLYSITSSPSKTTSSLASPAT